MLNDKLLYPEYPDIEKETQCFWTSLSFGEVYFLIENPSVTYLFYD